MTIASTLYCHLKFFAIAAAAPSFENDEERARRSSIFNISDSSSGARTT